MHKNSAVCFCILVQTHWLLFNDGTIHTYEWMDERFQPQAQNTLTAKRKNSIWHVHKRRRPAPMKSYFPIVIYGLSLRIYADIMEQNAFWLLLGNYFSFHVCVCSKWDENKSHFPRDSTIHECVIMCGIVREEKVEKVISAMIQIIVLLIIFTHSLRATHSLLQNRASSGSVEWFLWWKRFSDKSRIT